MELKVVALYDRAIKAYTRPFYVRSLAEAERSLRDEVGRDGSELSKHPEDYDLFYLGDFDEETGGFAMHDKHVKVISALDCVVKEKM